MAIFHIAMKDATGKQIAVTGKAFFDVDHAPANHSNRRAARSSTWVRNGLRSTRPGLESPVALRALRPRLRPLQIVGGPGSRRGRPHRCARVPGGAHGQLPGGESAHGQGKLRKGSRAGQQRKEGRQADCGAPNDHSALSAIIGSTRLARRAGIQQARKAIARSRKAMKVKVIGSVALTP
jgi:hypothetical protein